MTLFRACLLCLCVIISGYPITTFSHQKSEIPEALCGISKSTEFEFNNSEKTKFVIPDAYLYDPWGAYNKAKKPAKFINILLVKKDLKAKN